MTVVRIDARGLLCPLPVLRARKALAGVAPGTRIEVMADDPAAVVDMPHFCAQAGHRLVSVTDADGGQVYLLERGAAI